MLFKGLVGWIWRLLKSLSIVFIGREGKWLLKCDYNVKDHQYAFSDLCGLREQEEKTSTMSRKRIWFVFLAFDAVYLHDFCGFLVLSSSTTNDGSIWLELLQLLWQSVHISPRMRSFWILQRNEQKCQDASEFFNKS